MSIKKEIDIFDLDGTIFDINTTLSFVFFVTRRNIVKCIKFAIYLVLSNVYQNKFRNKIVSLLKGYSKTQLQQYSKIFVSKIFNSTRRVEHVVKRLISSRNKIIVSAGLDIVVKEVAKKFKCNVWIASELDFSHNICTGKYKNDILGVKYKTVIKHVGRRKITIYTDNFEDLDVVNKSTMSYLICHDKNQEKIWENKLNSNVVFEFIEAFKPYRSGVNNKTYIVSYIPGFLYYFTRNGSAIIQMILLKEIIPLIILTNDVYSSINAIFSYLIFLSLYEIPIFYNDYILVKNDLNPTRRIPDDLKYNMPVFVVIRVLFSAICLYLVNLPTVNKMHFLLSMVVLFVIFTIHNLEVDKKKRSKTFLLIRVFKSLSYAVLLLPFKTALYYVVIISLIEHVRTYFNHKNLGFGLTVGKSLFMVLIFNSLAIITSISQPFLMYYLVFLTLITLLNYVGNYLMYYII